MRDLQDWQKQLDLAAKQAKRARDLAAHSAAPPKPTAVRPERGHGLPPPAMAVPESAMAEVRPSLLPPRKGRGPRKMESREDLLARLINPTLTLEETARILEVCPTTVRRWTNKGVLPHERSGGNQRRFKLSVVLDFLDARTTTSPGAES